MGGISLLDFIFISHFTLSLQQINLIISDQASRRRTSPDLCDIHWMKGNIDQYRSSSYCLTKAAKH